MQMLTKKHFLIKFAGKKHFIQHFHKGLLPFNFGKISKMLFWYYKDCFPSKKKRKIVFFFGGWGGGGNSNPYL